MKVSHILYKVDHLDEAVKSYEEQGFVVEYGKEKNPYNALIYFSDGPYFELFQNSGMPGFFKLLLRMLGKKAMVERIEFWEGAGERLIGVALENYEENLDKEKAILKKYHQTYFEMKSGRNDTKGRALRFRGIFPDELQIPFMMTYFNIDPKPKNFVHPNGVKRIKSISFGTKEEWIPLIQELCDDSTLKLYIGEGVKDMEFEKA